VQNSPHASDLLARAQQLHGQGQVAAAAECLRRYLDVVPGAAPQWYLLGVMCDTLGDAEGALRAYSEAVKQDPGFVDAQLNLGVTLAELGRATEALPALERAVALAPDDVEILQNYALTLLDAGKCEAALDAVARAAASGLAPDRAAGLAGAAYARAGRLAEAEREYRRALDIQPDLAAAAIGLGVVLQESGRIDDAIAGYRAFLGRDPANPAVNFALCLALLANGSPLEAWRHYAGRPPARARATRHAPPRDFRALARQAVLIEHEQGIGDELFFLRFVPLLRSIAQPSRIVYVPSTRLHPALQSAASIDELRPQAPSYWSGPRLLVGDLPALCSAAPDAPPYPDTLRLKPDPANLARWRAFLQAQGSGPYLAVSWEAGSPADTRKDVLRGGYRLQKRIEPELLGRALAGWPGTLVSVQRHPRAADSAAFRAACEREPVDASLANEEIGDLLALLTLVDEVVGVSSTGMHLRAAAGRTARVLIPYPAEWRWQARGEESPWFPGFSVYRQRMDQDWSEALARLRRDLLL
jgi:tetratricopeptide (TPR) repeat protein